MKKFSLLSLILCTVVFQFCHSAKKARASAMAKVDYATDIQPVVAASCSPCHFPPKGNKKPLDTYLGVSDNIDSILVRIQKNPDEKGFMPFKHPKLPDSIINLFIQFKKDGLQSK